MEKYENIVKSSEIRKLVDKKMYQKALMILDTIDVNKIKILTDLSVFAEVYIQTGRYEDANKLLLRLREKSGSRRIIYQLIKLAIRMNDIENAEMFYNEYVAIAPRDSEKYILRYRIEKMKGSSYEDLISPLEELKEYDYIEKWSYELAKLYHKAGMKDKCIRECSDIILWFGEGIIVEKAKMLKAHYVSNSHHVSAYSASQKREMEEQKQLYKTKDLSKESDAIRIMLEGEDDDFFAETTYEEEKSLPVKVNDYEEILQEALDETSDNTRVEIIEEEITEEISIEEEITEEISIEEEITEEESIEEEIIEEESVEEQIIKKEYGNLQEEVMEAIQDGMQEDIKQEELLYQQMENIFGYFIHNEIIQSKLIASISNMYKESEAKNMIIEGHPGSGRTTLCKLIVQALQQLGVVSYNKIAKINGEQLNQLDLEEYYTTLMDGALIIENISQLTMQTNYGLIRMMGELKQRIIVFLEGTPEQIRKYYDEHPYMLMHFEEKIILPEYFAEDLYGFGIELVNKNGMFLSDQAIEQLKVLVVQIEETIPSIRRLACLNNVVEQVINNAKRRIFDLLDGNIEIEETSSDNNRQEIKDCDFEQM